MIPNPATTSPRIAAGPIAAKATLMTDPIPCDIMLRMLMPLDAASPKTPGIPPILEEKTPTSTAASRNTSPITPPKLLIFPPRPPKIPVNFVKPLVAGLNASRPPTKLRIGAAEDIVPLNFSMAPSANLVPFKKWSKTGLIVAIASVKF